eukprot:TRINITY_DN858_c1_g1_i1.p1 TRINITY_DN858_c1_g1~~TRINITY_DN858_c1_g1_i1.p1  ORF type:complete len:225 (-),score=28.20 TRINITY_DN858_c1_g1_i1:79-753(-)
MTADRRELRICDKQWILSFDKKEVRSSGNDPKFIIVIINHQKPHKMTKEKLLENSDEKKKKKKQTCIVITVICCFYFPMFWFTGGWVYFNSYSQFDSDSIFDKLEDCYILDASVLKVNSKYNTVWTVNFTDSSKNYEIKKSVVTRDDGERYIVTYPPHSSAECWYSSTIDQVIWKSDKYTEAELGSVVNFLVWFLVISHLALVLLIRLVMCCPEECWILTKILR